MSPPRRFRAKLGIAAFSRRAGERKPAAAAVRKIVEQDTAGVELWRDRKADLRSAGTVWRHRVGDLMRSTPRLRCHPLLPLCCNGRLDASYRAMNSGDIARRRSSSIRPERVM